MLHPDSPLGAHLPNHNKILITFDKIIWEVIFSPNSGGIKMSVNRSDMFSIMVIIIRMVIFYYHCSVKGMILKQHTPF